MRLVYEPILPNTGTFNYEVVENADTIDNPKYQQVEYLESDGTQYIDTLLAGNQDTAIECKFNTTSYTSTNYVSLLGYYSGTDNSITGFMGISSGYGRSRFGNTSTVDTAVSLNTDYVLYMDKTKFKLNNTETSWSCTNTFTTEGTLRLFSRYIETYGNFNGKIYYAKIWQYGTLIRHLIPVIRKADNKPGMYDKVTGQFFTNSSTTGDDFKYGEKVYTVLPSKYEKLEYLKSDGNQYISTGVSKGSVSTFGLEATMSFDDRTVVNALGVGQSLSGGCFGIKNGTNANIYFNLTGSDEYSTYTYTVGVPLYFNLDGVAKTFTIKDLSGTTLYTDTRTTSTITDNTDIILFGYINTSGNNPRKQTMYNCKIYNDGELVRDLVPALRKADNKPGMYDFVSGQFFTNLGSGEFTYAYPVKPLSNSKLRLVKSGYATPTLTKPLVTRLIAGGYV